MSSNPVFIAHRPVTRGELADWLRRVVAEARTSNSFEHHAAAALLERLADEACPPGDGGCGTPEPPPKPE